MNLEYIKAIIRNIPDFPKQSVQFKDITPILNNPKAFHYIIELFADFARKNQVTAILAPESRGFIFGSALAYHLNLKFVPARKAGKLPYKTYKVNYDLEYGTTTLEIHQDAFMQDDRILIIDDLVATSGTMHACIELVKFTQAKIVGIASLISLSEFKNQQIFAKNYPYLNLIEF